MKTVLLLCIKCSILFALYAGSCNVVPPFPGGIRMSAEEAPVESQDAQLPVEFVADSGNIRQITGPGRGTAPIFQGLTNLNGVDDHPNAQTNAIWVVVWDFTTSEIPQCGIGQRVEEVPSTLGGGAQEGAWFDRVCLL